MKPAPITPEAFRATNRLILRTVSALLGSSAVRRATVYIAPKFVAKATRQRKPDGRTTSETYLLTVGSPNYYERRFIKACQKAGEPFPVKAVQLKFYQEDK